MCVQRKLLEEARESLSPFSDTFVKRHYYMYCIENNLPPCRKTLDRLLAERTELEKKLLAYKKQEENS